MKEFKTYGERDQKYTKDNCPTILKWITPNSRVLEFGPAYGYMTRYMKEELNCCVTCVELNSDMREILQQWAEQVIIADLDTDSWEDQVRGKFDYIIFADVLEHLRNPLLTMGKAIQFSNCIVTSIPNIGHASILLSLLDGEFIYHQLGLLDNTHIHFFTRKSINELMVTFNFRCSDEKNNINLYPFNTEFKKFYAQHLLAAWSIVRKPDSSVYQFVNKWEKMDDAVLDINTKPLCHSISQSIRILTLDILKFLFEACHFKKTNFLRKIWKKIN